MYRVQVGQPELGPEETEAVLRVMQSGRLTQGAEVAAFEQAFAKVVDSKHAIAVNSGTAALHLALEASGIGPGDEVIVPTTTFVATANAVRYTGATPVFADVDDRHWCLTGETVERVLTPRTRAILPVHLYGVPAPMFELEDIALRRNLLIIEDAAEALGAEFAECPVGTFGQAGVFSFYGNKTITTGEGGMVVTDSDWLAERVRLLRGQAQGSRRYWHEAVGYNYRMTELQAAIGRAQLVKLPVLLDVRKQWLKEYEVLSDLVEFQAVTKFGTHGCWAAAGRLISCDESAVRRRLEQVGIETRPVFPPVHTMPPYNSPTNLPVAEELYESGLVLPLHTGLTDELFELICSAVRG